jgi:DNA repair protein RecO (recombination protein O)
MSWVISGLVESAIAASVPCSNANVRGRSSGFTARLASRLPAPAAIGRAVYRHSMPAPRRYVTDAIVLSRFDYGEADRILTLITPGAGKIKAIAKGIRRQKSRIGGSLEPFAELRLALAQGRTFEVVTQVEVIHPWLNLRDNLISFGTASYIAELANGTLEERHAAESVYIMLKRAYEILDAGMAPGRVARWFEMHLADELGVRPEVDRCVECGRLLEADERYRWMPPLGGVLCERCPGPPFERSGLSLDALKLLKAYQRQDVEALAALRVRPAVEREVEMAMREFLAYSLDRRPRSLAFLDEVRAASAAEAVDAVPVAPAR